MEAESTPLPAAKSSPRRRWRFSLRALLIAMPILGLLLGWIGGEVRRHDQDLAAAEQLNSKFNTNWWNPLEGRWVFAPLQAGQLARGRLYRPHSTLWIGKLNLQVQPFAAADWSTLGRLVGLQDLGLNDYQGPATGPTFGQLPALEKLALEDCRLTRNDLLQIQTLLQLRMLQISQVTSYFDSITRATDRDESLAGRMTLDFGPKPWPHLEHLSLSYLNIPASCLTAIVGSVQLRELSLVSCGLPPQALRRLGALTQLERLALVCDPVPYHQDEPYLDGDLDHAALQQVGRLPHLAGLRLQNAWLVDFGGAGDDLSQRWPRLRELNLTQVHVTRQTLAEIAAIPHLETIYADQCYFDSDAFAPLVAAKSLKTVHLAHLRRDDPVVAGLADLPQLETLTLQGDLVTDETLRDVAQLRQLRSLSLAANQVTDAGIALLAGHPRLVQIKLDVPRLTERTIASLAQIPNLSFADSSLDAPVAVTGLWEEVKLTQAAGQDVAALLAAKQIFPAEPPAAVKQ